MAAPPTITVFSCALTIHVLMQIAAIKSDVILNIFFIFLFLIYYFYEQLLFIGTSFYQAYFINCFNHVRLISVDGFIKIYAKKIPHVNAGFKNSFKIFYDVLPITTISDRVGVGLPPCFSSVIANASA